MNANTQHIIQDSLNSLSTKLQEQQHRNHTEQVQMIQNALQEIRQEMPQLINTAISQQLTQYNHQLTQQMTHSQKLMDELQGVLDGLQTTQSQIPSQVAKTVQASLDTHHQHLQEQIHSHQSLADDLQALYTQGKHLIANAQGELDNIKTEHNTHLMALVSYQQNINRQQAELAQIINHLKETFRN